MNTFLSDSIYAVFAAVYWPHFWLKTHKTGEMKRIFSQRLGNLPESLKNEFGGKKIVWIHAVSVGEVMAMRRFIQGLLEHHPDLNILLTTVTPTGQKIAKELESARLRVCYFPFDFSFSVRRYFEAFKPQCLLLAETEIWPNLLLEARKANVPVGVLNARLSEKSSKGYGRFKMLFNPLFQSLSFVLAQTDEDAKRFTGLGVLPGCVHTIGNMKYDNVSLEEVSLSAINALRENWGFSHDDRILIAGSTHPGEEEMILKIYSQLQSQIKNLKIIIAPRHIDRSDQLMQLCRRMELRARLSTVREGRESFDVLVLNQLGILKNLYAVADVVFVGGSMIRRGGQNPIEPASFKKAILYGPHVFNFKNVYECLQQEGGALCVTDEAQLAFALNRLLRNSKECEQLGENAFLTVQKLQGATNRHLDWVSEFLSPGVKERKDDVELHAKLLSKSGRGV